MKLSINVNPLLSRYNLAACIDIYKTAGFTAMDYPLFDMITEDCVFNSIHYRDAAKEIRALVDSKGVQINQTHAPFSYPLAKWNDPVYYEEFIFPSHVRSLEISAILGADVVVVHPLHHMCYKGHEEELFQLNMDYYGKLIPYAKEYGIKIGVENMWQFDPLRKCIIADTCSDVKEFIRYIDTLNSDQITGCLDVGHVGLPVTAELSVGDVIRRLGHDRLGALHIHDNDFKGDLHVLPYLGQLDWADIAKALGEIDYKGDFTYEVNGQLVATVDEGFVSVGAAFMANTGKHIMSMINANRPKELK